MKVVEVVWQGGGEGKFYKTTEKRIIDTHLHFIFPVEGVVVLNGDDGIFGLRVFGLRAAGAVIKVTPIRVGIVRVNAADAMDVSQSCVRSPSLQRHENV